MKSLINKPVSVIIFILSLALIAYSVVPLLLPKAKPEKFEMIWSDSSTCKFNTVFGGTDYNEEVMKYFQNNPYDDYELLLETIGSLKNVSKTISKLDYTPETKEVYTEVTALDENSENTCQTVTTNLIAIGFIENYNVCAWEHGTKNIYIISEKDRVFNIDRYEREMYHVGSKAYVSANMEHIKTKEINGYKIFFIGGYKYD